MKLLGFSFAMVVIPIGMYFVTVDFGGEHPNYTTLTNYLHVD